MTSEEKLARVVQFINDTHKTMGITYQSMADTYGISYSYFRKIYKGNRISVSAETLEKLIKFSKFYNGGKDLDFGGESND